MGRLNKFLIYSFTFISSFANINANASFFKNNENENLNLICTVKEYKSSIYDKFEDFPIDKYKSCGTYKFNFNLKNKTGYVHSYYDEEDQLTPYHNKVNNLNINIIAKDYIEGSYNSDDSSQVFTFRINRFNGEMLRIMETKSEFKVHVSKALCIKIKDKRTLF